MQTGKILVCPSLTISYIKSEIICSDTHIFLSDRSESAKRSLGDTDLVGEYAHSISFIDLCGNIA